VLYGDGVMKPVGRLSHNKEVPGRRELSAGRAGSMNCPFSSRGGGGGCCNCLSTVAGVRVSPLSLDWGGSVLVR
jgi:hypothetical protein